jgi:ABC-type uncharacterized transport system ATPase subunit
VTANAPALPALQLRAITRLFGATCALDGADLTVRRGTLHALLGENGAGKTTLMRLAFGMLAPNSGTIAVDGTARRWRSSADAIAAGIGMVHQHFLLVPAMTAAENVALGDRGFVRGFDPAHAADRVRRIGELSGLVVDPGARVDEMPVGAQQRLEIVKALARDARLLILDEPTAVLSPAEAADLYGWLRRFVDGGDTAVLITHKVREALSIADDVTVLRRGRTVLEAPSKTLDERDVIRAMLGGIVDLPAREPVAAAAAAAALVAPPVIAVRGVSFVDARGITRLHNATLAVSPGEIVGLAGVEGAGQAELLRIMAGRLAVTSGDVLLPTRLGFAPEDRLRDAIIPSMTLVENFALHDSEWRHGVMPWQDLASATSTLLRDHDVRSSGATARAGSLSGGNQQTFVLGRELAGLPQALVVENPTRGLDVRAAAQVLRRLRDARDTGVGIVMYSSDLDEVLSIADRMAVCFGGRVVEVARTADAVGRAMVGLT